MEFDWKKTLAAVAPVLASALGSPVAGTAMQLLAKEWLGKEDAAMDEIAAALIKATPADLRQLKELDQQFKKDMASLKLQVYQEDAKDRASARTMALKNMGPQIALSILYTIGYIIVLWVFMSGKTVIAPGTETPFSIVLGVLTSAQVQILNFWFGSSSGSKEKDHPPRDSRDPYSQYF